MKKTIEMPMSDFADMMELEYRKGMQDANDANEAKVFLVVIISVVVAVVVSIIFLVIIHPVPDDQIPPECLAVDKEMALSGERFSTQDCARRVNRANELTTQNN